VAYVIGREGRSGARYVGIYRAAGGKYKSAGTYDSHERAYEVAEDEERHARGFLDETSPSDKAKMTISEFCEQRFLPYHAITLSTRQEYGYTAKNHIVPYIGHLRISEVDRETFFNLLVKVLPSEEASQVTVRATRVVLSAMCRWHSTRATGTTTPYEASGSSRHRPSRCSSPAMTSGGASKRR
jgi:hypothetical protein